MVNRRGRAQAPEGVEVIGDNATNPVSARRVCEGAAVVFHCASGAYGRWPQTLPAIMNGIIEGAAAAGAKLVYGDNLSLKGRFQTAIFGMVTCLSLKGPVLGGLFGHPPEKTVALAVPSILRPTRPPVLR
jgi:hypothetical protein